METIFDQDISLMVRRYLIQHTPELEKAFNPGVSVAVVNAADKCTLTCPNCLFSATLASKVFDGNPPHISMSQIARFVQIMNEAELQLVVFSGGGESFENLEAMCYAVENLQYLQQTVCITSGYFASTEDETRGVLDKFTAAILRGNKLRGGSSDLIIRLSFDNFHKVSIKNIVRIINYARSFRHAGLTAQKYTSYQVHPEWGNRQRSFICGFANPELFKGVYEPEEDVLAELILLDVSPQVIEERLRKRHSDPESIKEIERATGVSLEQFIEGCKAATSSLKKTFEDYGGLIIDTDGNTPEETATEVVEVIKNPR